MKVIRENKQAILFLVKFLGVYFALNILYGIWVESYTPKADPATYMVASHTISFLDLFYDELELDYYESTPKVWMGHGGHIMINAYEGCNGINVTILFLAFLFAYRGPLKNTLIFSVAGIAIIYIMNIGRIAFLYSIADNYPEYLYFTHKYLFTASIYGVIFLIWIFWVRKINALRKSTKDDSND